MVTNSAGGLSWALDDWGRLDRFLILGADGPTYYASARQLTVENAASALRCIRQDGPRAVARIAEISRSGRAPRNDAAVFALAMALKTGDDDTRRAARLAVPAICRTGTHLFQLAEGVNAFGGWGRGTRGAFADWYQQMPLERLVLQAMKYQRRGGWSHRDLLRKCHPRAADARRDAVYRWMVRGWEGRLPLGAPEDATRGLWAFEQVKRAGSADEVADVVRAHGLPRECVPSEHLKDPGVWEALLFAGRGMPMTAMLRCLGRMAAVGLFESRANADRVAARLTGAEALRGARVHPLSVLAALSTYRAGRGVKGALRWAVSKPIVEALDAAFYQSFSNLEASGKRWMLSLDVSGSMGCGAVAGTPGITPRVGSAAMALVTASVEPEHAFVAFGHALVPLDIRAGQKLDRVIRTVSGLPFGGTDCALPMRYALKNRIAVDTFAIYTDSETWFGDIHPARALEDYRQAMGIDARLIVVGMTSGGFTIADPADGGMLDVVGFDAAAPALMRGFAAG